MTIDVLEKITMAPKDYLGSDQRKVADDKEKKVDDIKVLDAGDIHLLKTYGQVAKCLVVCL